MAPSPKGSSEQPFFLAATSMDLLRAGYEKVARNNGCAGGDGVSVSLFGFGLEMRLKQLHVALRTGRYTPAAVARFEIPKPGRIEKRVLMVPSVRDRVAQTAAILAIGDRLEQAFEPSSFAYRPGRSVAKAIAAVARHHDAGFTTVVDADIRAFFDTVPHDRLLGVLGSHVPERRFLDLVGQWLATSPDPGRGLPQGAPISPLLANLYLDAVDEAVAEAGFRIVRYADDFVILCRGKARAERALDLVAKLLSELGLELNPEKTRIRSLADGYDFLGETIGPTTLARQMAELAADADDSPAGSRVATDAIPLDGSLGVPGSRHMLGQTYADPPDRPAAVPAALDHPLTPVEAYVAEGSEAEPMPTPVAGAETASRHAPYIRPLIVLERGRRLDVWQTSLAIFEGQDPIAIVPVEMIDRIDLHPGVDATSQAIRLAARRALPVFFVDADGEADAVMVADDVRRSSLHLAQARHALDPLLATDLARRFVGGRIYNARRLIQRLRGRLDAAARTERGDLDRVIGRLDRLKRSAELDPKLTTVDAVRGVEAAAAALYWPALASLVKRGFAEPSFRRTRLPPQSPLNCLFNWTAGFLRRDIDTLVRRRGLHPGFGALHTVTDARDAAVFDLMEEFRAPVAEALAAQLLSTATLTADHFEAIDVDGTPAVRLANGGSTKAIRAYESFVDKVVNNPATGGKTNWRGLMDYQVTAYMNHLLGGPPYEPYRMDF